MMQSAIPPGDKNNIRIIGKSQGFLGLAVHFTVTTDAAIDGPVPCLQTAWTPTEDEIAAINSGANIIVQLLGALHPPIAVYVGEAPE